MKRERIFYLDFIRAIATISILLTHFNAIYLFSYPNQHDKVVLTGSVCGIYIGDFGVSLFFIISGAALMYVYQDKLELKTFFYKRFKSIYPMFWIAYIIAFLYFFFINKGIPVGVPKRNMIFSILGFDGYLSSLGIHFPNFYILGEWFLGAIVLLYMIFPVLRWGVQKHPYICAAISAVLYIACAILYHGNFTKSCIIFNRIPEMLFGMYFVRYIKKVNYKMAIISIIVLILNIICKPNWNSTIQTTYVGFASFLVLVYISTYIACSPIKKICGIIGKYSYAIFLVHHVVMQELTKSFDMANINKTNSYILFILCCLIIAILAKGLYILDKAIEREALK